MTACTKADKQDKTTLNDAALKGPTGMGMIKLIDDADKGNTKNEYKITLAGSPDEITGKIVSGEIQIAALPINLAANLYNKTNGKVQLLALNTLGVLYVKKARLILFPIWKAKRYLLQDRVPHRSIFLIIFSKRTM